MKHIFVDFEMNAVDKELEKIRAMCPREIIEIGAVALNDNMEEVDSFKRYVKPEFSDEVYERYETITGITTQMLEDAESFGTVLQEFLDWCGEDYTIYAWSGCDLAQIKAEARTKKFKNEQFEYMVQNWVDYQRMFDRSIKVKIPTSLEHALEISGLSFEGKPHDALCDAQNTGRLFVQRRPIDLQIAQMKKARRSSKRKLIT